MDGKHVKPACEKLEVFFFSSSLFGEAGFTFVVKYQVLTGNVDARYLIIKYK